MASENRRWNNLLLLYWKAWWQLIFCCCCVVIFLSVWRRGSVWQLVNSSQALSLSSLNSHPLKFHEFLCPFLCFLAFHSSFILVNLSHCCWGCTGATLPEPVFDVNTEQHKFWSVLSNYECYMSSTVGKLVLNCYFRIWIGLCVSACPLCLCSVVCLRCFKVNCTILCIWQVESKTDGLKLFFFFVMTDAWVFLLLYVLVTSVHVEIASFGTHSCVPVNVIVPALSGWACVII